MFARVILSHTSHALDKVLEYKIPEGMNVQTGDAVTVPFGVKNKPTQGFVVSVTNSSEFDERKIKSIKSIHTHPDTKAHLNDLNIPYWQEHLLIAAKAYEMTRLGYLGADIVIDKNKGPMMLELNARPGLAIQIANQIGLKKKLKEVKTYPTGLTPEERVDFLLNKK